MEERNPSEFDLLFFHDGAKGTRGRRFLPFSVIAAPGAYAHAFNAKLLIALANLLQLKEESNFFPARAVFFGHFFFFSPARLEVTLMEVCPLLIVQFEQVARSAGNI